ncbi:hypothetical protein J8F10_21320 [Gemmata sp. G18]|uniref:Two pore domain potassium channel family protein n=1 Tax=Gemmata palustris TaxID=2822762 RepID=A0ABS5BVP7_9BACT|nr:hypothetical protein [Gemmata palustris]MBP3957801.1 hypothetical protein [Gemmata palustris]
MSKRHLLRFESKHDALLPRPAFARRVARNFAVASALIGASLLGGMTGYHLTEDMGRIDAFANASMILSGMGPLEPLKTPGGKLFAGAYALYSGLVLVMASGVVLAPIVHRMFHRFHLEEDAGQ